MFYCCLVAEMVDMPMHIDLPLLLHGHIDDIVLQDKYETLPFTSKVQKVLTVCNILHTQIINNKYTHEDIITQALRV